MKLRPFLALALFALIVSILAAQFIVDWEQRATEEHHAGVGGQQR